MWRDPRKPDLRKTWHLRSLEIDIFENCWFVSLRNSRSLDPRELVAPSIVPRSFKINITDLFWSGMIEVIIPFSECYHPGNGMIFPADPGDHNFYTFSRTYLKWPKKSRRIRRQFLKLGPMVVDQHRTIITSRGATSVKFSCVSFYCDKWHPVPGWWYFQSISPYLDDDIMEEHHPGKGMIFLEWRDDHPA